MARQCGINASYSLSKTPDTHRLTDSDGRTHYIHRQTDRLRQTGSDRHILCGSQCRQTDMPPFRFLSRKPIAAAGDQPRADEQPPDPQRPATALPFRKSHDDGPDEFKLSGMLALTERCLWLSARDWL